MTKADKLTVEKQTRLRVVTCNSVFDVSNGCKIILEHREADAPETKLSAQSPAFPTTTVASVALPLTTIRPPFPILDAFLYAVLTSGSYPNPNSRSEFVEVLFC